jgi:hypothetical protein
MEEKFQDGDVRTKLVKGFTDLERAKEELDAIWENDWNHYKSEGRDEDDLNYIFRKFDNGFIEDFLDDDYTEYRIEKVEVN